MSVPEHGDVERHSHAQPIMDESLKRQLHATVEKIDHIHTEKEHKRQENQKKLAEFFGKLTHFADSFTKDMNKPDYLVVSATMPANQLGVDQAATLTIKRLGADFVTLTLKGTASSEATKVESNATFFRTGTNHPLGSVDDGILARVSSVLIESLGKAGEAFNKI